MANLPLGFVASRRLGVQLLTAEPLSESVQLAVAHPRVIVQLDGPQREAREKTHVQIF